MTNNDLEPVPNGEVYEKVKRAVTSDEEMADSTKDSKPCWSETTTTVIQPIDIWIEKVLGHIEDQPWQVTDEVHYHYGSQCS